MITREQLADLQPGDVVELTRRLFPEITLRGPVFASGSRDCDLVLPPVWVRERSGEPAEDMEMWATLTVVSRAVRPLYVNHDRAEPVPGDVVRDADDGKPVIWMYAPVTGMGTDDWVPSPMSEMYNHHRDQLPARLRLLVDGETGQVVQ